MDRLAVDASMGSARVLQGRDHQSRVPDPTISLRIQRSEVGKGSDAMGNCSGSHQGKTNPVANRSSVVTNVVIMGAAGRDFHNFNVVFRDDPVYRVVAFTAARYPPLQDEPIRRNWPGNSIQPGFQSSRKKSWNRLSRLIQSIRSSLPTAMSRMNRSCIRRPVRWLPEQISASWDPVPRCFARASRWCPSARCGPERARVLSRGRLLDG